MHIKFIVGENNVKLVDRYFYNFGVVLSKLTLI